MICLFAFPFLTFVNNFPFLTFANNLKKDFEGFFQAYISRFASKTLTSNDFKDFFLQHFKGNTKLEEIDWDVWYYAQGMPPVLPPLDQSMAKASTDLADSWFRFDLEATSLPSTNEISSWTSGQITCFLDSLQVKTADKALEISTLEAMNVLYNLAESRNSEILFRYCQLAIASEDESIVPIAVRFITSQGRMKFIRPLYKSLYRSNMGKDIAVSTFLANKDIYHPIASKMIAIDLKVAMEEASSSNMSTLFLTGITIVVLGVAVTLARRSRK